MTSGTRTTRTMKGTKRGWTLVVVALMSSLVGSVVGHETEYEFGWDVLTTKMPKALSDFTATLAAPPSSMQTGGSHVVYLAGGCDSVDGNVFNETSREFECWSISSELYMYDPFDEQFHTASLSPLPMARYRHAAVHVGGYIWIMGGRDSNDQIITQVDVYDIENDAWTTYDGLPAEYAVSDHAGFFHGNEACFVGGYAQDYEALNRTFAIDTAAVRAAGTIDPSSSIRELAQLSDARGDTSAASDAMSGDGGVDSTYVIVSGGFTHLDWCKPLSSVEMYNFENDTWTDIEPLQSPRADKAMVELNDTIYAVGGERQIENVCEIREDNTTDTPEPGELTIAVDDVERYDMLTDTWTKVTELPYHRFRFAAVGVSDLNAIVTFGGQRAFTMECRCFRTSDEIVVYREREVHNHDHSGDDSDDKSAAAAHIPTFFALSSTAILFLLSTWFL